MKQLILILLAIMLLNGILFGLSTGKALMFSDSFMLRARGTEAIYYNPALLNEEYSDMLLPITNISFFVANNSLDLDTYNYVMSREYLNQADKDYLLNNLEDQMKMSSEGHISIFGLTMGNIGLSSSLHIYSKSSLSKDYLELVLNGNTDSTYVFDKNDNNFSTMSFADISFGMGDIKLPVVVNEKPLLTVGFSTSLLVGIYDMYTKNFHGEISSTFDGLDVSHELNLHSGLGGAGFKAMLGAVSEPIPNLKVGATLDNILGFIDWGIVTQEFNYSVNADSVYVANLEDDILEIDYEDQDIGSYTTDLPMEFRLAGLYSIGDTSISADWVLPTDGSVIHSDKGVFSIGLETNPLKYFPIHFGLAFGNSEMPTRLSLGFGIETSYGDLGIGFQSYDSLLPGYNSKGISIGTYFNFQL